MCCIWENSANSSQQNSLFSSRLTSLWPSALIEQAGWHGRIQRRALIKPQSASDSNGLPLDDPHTSGRRPDSNRLFAAGSIQNRPSRGESCVRLQLNCYSLFCICTVNCFLNLTWKEKKHKLLWSDSEPAYVIGKSQFPSLSSLFVQPSISKWYPCRQKCSATGTTWCHK